MAELSGNSATSGTSMPIVRGFTQAVPISWTPFFTRQYHSAGARRGSAGSIRHPLSFRE